ncbi:Protein of unknown function [Pyronema omphalodes CBS 100304]|uniref:Uncharacterized protein n=1 Tax=Pyronema omphalodes (strain CBS 100304) TaxID=1076935 RepID=U4LUK6_PYROM|nr:Protein of unknown function [Pyronema omphalodes CBS 100304]
MPVFKSVIARIHLNISTTSWETEQGEMTKVRSYSTYRRSPVKALRPDSRFVRDK